MPGQQLLNRFRLAQVGRDQCRAEPDLRAIRPHTPIAHPRNLNAFYEEEELDIIAENFPTNGRYCDIGANIGNHSIFVGLYLAPKRIVVVEPNPPAIELLTTNIFLNHLDSICDMSKLGFALSDSAFDAASMRFGVRNLGGARIVPRGGEISVRTGDELIGSEDFDFIKIDVEGGELAVLKGLEQTITRCSPTIFIEVDNKNSDAFDEWLSRMGYHKIREFQRYKANTNFLVRRQTS